MSATELPTVTVGQIVKDLSKTRADAEDYELIRLQFARFLAVSGVDDECYFHFGSKEAPGIDVRDLEGSTLNRPTEIDAGIGAIYLENPSGATGSLTLFTGVDLETTPQPDLGSIDELEKINQTVTVDNTDDQTRQLGKVRVEDSGGVLTDPLDAADMGPFSDRVTAVSTNATVSPGEYGQPVTIVADTSGSATLTVEVSQDGGSNWDAYTISIGGAEGHKEEVHGFADVRASVNQNLNALTVSAKGV